jgi:DNA-binding NtrC family response regulator
VNLRARAAELGAADYVSKPVDSDRLLEIVGRHCPR